MPTIIALSAKRGCGKSTVARMLVKKFMDCGVAAETFSLATVLKRYVEDTYGIPVSWSNDQDKKRTPLSKSDFPKIPRDGMTLRMLLQETGAALRRDDPAFTVHGIPETNKIVVIDDVRMPAEDDAVRKLGGLRVRIEPYPGYDIHDFDITETALDDVSDWDMVFHPEFGDGELEKVCDEILDMYWKKVR